MRAEAKARKVGAYIAVFEKTGTGYSAYVPDLPGCIAAGDTVQKTSELMREAIEMHISGMREDGLPVPEPTTTVEEAPRPLSLARSWDGHGVHRAAARRRMRSLARKRRG